MNDTLWPWVLYNCYSDRFNPVRLKMIQFSNLQRLKFKKLFWIWNTFFIRQFLRAFQIQEILEREKKSGYTSCIFFPSFFLFLFPSFVFLLSLSVFSEILTQIKLSTFFSLFLQIWSKLQKFCMLRAVGNGLRRLFKSRNTLFLYGNLPTKINLIWLELRTKFFSSKLGRKLKSCKRVRPIRPTRQWFSTF